MVDKEASVVGVADKPEPSLAKLALDPQFDIPNTLFGTVVIVSGVITGDVVPAEGQTHST